VRATFRMLVLVHVGTNGDTRPLIRYRIHHLRWPDIDMYDTRGSFSRLKKGIKHRFQGEKHAPKQVAANAARE
jgi:hypothetical protein